MLSFRVEINVAVNVPTLAEKTARLLQPAAKFLKNPARAAATRAECGQ